MSAAKSNEADLVAAAQQRWSDAILTNDAEIIAGLMLEGWAIVTPSGVVTAAQFLDAIRVGTLSHSCMQPAPAPDGSPRVTVYGEVAVLTQRLLSTETAGGRSRDNDEWMTTVFVRRHDRWLAATMQVTPAA